MGVSWWGARAPASLVHAAGLGQPEAAGEKELVELFEALVAELARFLEQNLVALVAFAVAGGALLAWMALRKPAEEAGGRRRGSRRTPQDREEQLRSLGDTFNALANLLGQPGAPAGVAEAIEQLGEGRPEAAERIFEEVLVEAEKAGLSGKHNLEESAVLAANRTGAEAATHLGNLASLYDLDKAVEMYRRAVLLDRADAAILNRLGVALLKSGELKEAERIHRRALDLAEHESLLPEKADSLRFLGLVYLRRNQLDRAETMLHRALEVDRQRGNRPGIAVCYRELAALQEQSGEADQAEDLLEKALEIHRRDGERVGQVEVRTRLGMLYWRQDRLDEAEKMVKKALSISEKLERRPGIAAARGNLALIYEKRGQDERAEETLRQALDLYRQLGDRRGQGIAYGNLGVLHHRRGELDRAEEMHRKALEIHEELLSRGDAARELTHLGKLAKERDELEEAEKRLNEALKIDQELGRPEDLAILHAQLAEVYRLQGEEAWAEEMRGMIPPDVTVREPEERRGTFE